MLKTDEKYLRTKRNINQALGQGEKDYTFCDFGTAVQKYQVVVTTNCPLFILGAL
jgi:hypothetical protein